VRQDERRLGGKGPVEQLVQLYVPDVDDSRQRFLRRAHGSAPREGSGDGLPAEGARKMFERLQRDHYWDTMLHDCEVMRKKCLVCKQHEEMRTTAGLLEPRTSASLAGQHIVYADFAGPLPATSRGNKYVLVCVDEKGWPLLAATKDTESATIIEVYKQVGMRVYGIPHKFVTDRASNFTSKEVAALLKAQGVEKVTTTSYHPQANPAETMVKAAKRVVAKLASEYKKDWDETLVQAELALISWEKSPYGMSPYKMRTGVDMPQPSMFENPMHVEAAPTAAKMKEIEEAIKVARDEAAEKMKDEYDARHVEKHFKEGDRVWWREHEPASKIAPKRSGPYEVKKVLSDLNYELAELPQGPKIGTRHKIVHVQHLEEFDVDGGEEEEEEVEEVLRHSRRKGKIRYLTKFKSGEEIWLTEKDLIDKEEAGYLINEELKRYWAKTPTLRPWINKYLG